MQITPACLTQAVDQETAGSKILWSGQPTPKEFTRGRWKQAASGIPFTAFSVLWTWLAAGGASHDKHNSAPLPFVLWGCMFICFGLMMLLSPFSAMWQATRTFYVVTDQRAIIFQKRWTLKIHSFEAARLEGFERISHGGTAGDILFQREIMQGKRTRIESVGFIGLPDYTDAERALRQVIERNRKAET